MKKVIIRNFRKSDITDQYISWLNNKNLMKYSENRYHKFTKKKCLSFFYKLKQKKHFFFLIKKNNKLKKPIGTIIGRLDKRNSVCDLGILISETGKGYGIDAWNLAISLIFSKKIRKITAGTMSLNYPMLKVFRLSNMKFEYKKKNQFLYNNNEIDLIGYRIYRNDHKKK